MHRTALFVTELMDCNLFELLRTKTTLDFGTKIKLAIDIELQGVNVVVCSVFLFDVLNILLRE